MPEGIPALDDPAVIPGADAEYLTPEDLVFGVALRRDASAEDDGSVEARAYPLRILDWHEMTNDIVAGVPVVRLRSPSGRAPCIHYLLAPAEGEAVDGDSSRANRSFHWDWRVRVSSSRASVTSTG